MPFNADGSYTGTDAAIPHVQVATKSYTGHLRLGGQVTVPAGAVLQARTMGTTNALAQGAGPNGAAWIEHATAKPTDVLAEADVTAGVALMAQRKAAIEAYRTAEATKPQPPTLEQRVAAIEAKLAATPPAAAAH